MAIKQVVPGLYQVSLGIVNSFILDDGGDLTLIDSGVAGSDAKIMAGVAELGKGPGDVGRILVTHAHGDHTGGLAALKRQTGAPVYIHPADGALIATGQSARPAKAAPGVMNALITRMMRPPATAARARWCRRWEWRNTSRRCTSTAHRRAITASPTN